jgi:hypothetical protein
MSIEVTGELKDALKQLRDNKELTLNGNESDEDVIWKLFEFYEVIICNDMMDIDKVLREFSD